VTQFDSLLDAEAESLRGDHYNACRHYEAAVLYAGRRGWRQDQALAHERYGTHLSRLEAGGDRHDHDHHRNDAHFHLREAVKLYDEWGAHAKVDLMRRAHSSLGQVPPAPNRGIEILDMGRVKSAAA
jgi:hypothetical protein